MAPVRYSVEHLRQLWARGDSYTEIAAALGCRESLVHKLKKRHGLPNRGRRQSRPVPDPTPDEIEQRAEEVRAMRRMPEDHPGRVETPVLAWDGWAFGRIE